MEMPVLVDRRGAVQWITINRPERRNALNEEVIRAIGQGITQAIEDETCRAIVLTGVGDQAFCAGADLQKNTNGGAFDVNFSRPRHYVVDLFKQIQECSLPLIARVNGLVLAGGIGLLCACDMAIATADARFGTPEVRIGVTPMMILPYMLRVIPHRTLMEMCITGEPLDAPAALQIGLVNYVVPSAELDAKVDWLIGRIAEKSPTAVRLGKQAFNAMRDMSLRESLEYAQVMVPVMASTADASEGRAAFQQKRQPNWTGG
jgi:enoyl-CoA hydratase/carnithine racemase